MAAPAPPTSVWSLSEDNTRPPQVPGGDMTQNGPRAWERAWSVQEMRTEAGKWSLAGDAGLLLHLQEFSQRLISRTHEIGQEMDGLVHEVKLTSVQVNNVVNNFITLANSQFVENRVYDEDVSHAAASQQENKSEQQELTREQREAELMPRVTTALRLGMDVIETAFERIETATMESDSEDEDNAYRADPILEAKDPYLTRTLPFLIGSPQFLEDDSVGLVEELSEDEEAESDHDSVSASEDDQESEESETEYSTSGESGDDSKKKAKRRTQRAMAESDTSTDSQEAESDEDMFVAKKPKKISDQDEESADASNSEEEANEEYEKAGPSAVAVDFSSELAARLGVAATKQHPKGMDSDGGGGDDDDWEQEHTDKKHTITSNKQKQSKETRKEKVKDDVREKADRGKGKGKHPKVKGEGDDLFGRSDQPDDDDFFGKPGGLFSTGKGLFDEDADADEGDLFGDVEKAPVKSKRKQSTERDDGSVLSDETKGEEEEEVHREKAVDSRPRTKSGKVLPKGAVSVFGPGADFLASARSDTSDTHVVIKPTAQPAVVPVKSGGEGGLFDDDDEDDALFGGAPHRRETLQKDAPESTKPGTAAATASKKVDLFADDDEEDDLFGSMAAPVTKRKSHSNVGLIVEDEMKEENSSENEAPRKTVAPEKKLPPGAVSMFGDGPNPFVAALKKQQKAAASEEDKDGWSEEDTNSQSFTKPGGSSTTTSATTKQLAPDGEDDDDDFLTAKLPSRSKYSEKSVKNLPRNNSGQNLPQFDGKKTARESLFNDADDEDSDFFSAATQPLGRKQPAAAAVSSGVDAPRTVAGSQSSRRSSRDLFSNDDLLFAAGEDENPTVDLFSSQGPLRQQSSQEKDTPRPSTSSPAKKATTTSSKTNTPSLFAGDDDDDDDGLFSPGGLTKLTAAAPPSKLLADVTESKSAGDMESKEEEPKPDVSKPKKPAGAVSMFGGLDPSAILKKRRPPSESDDEKDKDDEKQEKKEEKETPVKEETSQDKSPVSVSSKLAVNLFGRDDDADKSSDDLFPQKSDTENKVEDASTGESTDTPDKEEAEKPKPEPTKPKKPAGAVSMFGGLDPSFFLKKRKVEEPEENDDDEKDQEKPAPPEPAPKTAPKPKLSVTVSQDSTRPKPPGDLFGAADEDDSDDLFGAPKKKVPPPTAPRTPVPTPTDSSKSEEELPAAEPAKPKMPAGAVPMFGGINPFAGLKKKSVSIEEDENEPSPPREELKSPTSSPILLSPDAAHPTSLERGDSVDFDQPPEADPLTTAIKDRPKLNRRRPQSRKARMLAATHTGISFEDVTPTTPTTPTIPEDPDNVQDLPSLNTVSSPRNATDEPSDDNKNNDSGADKSEKPQTKSADLFGNDDLLDGPSLSAGKPQADLDEQSVKGDQLFRKDLFAGKNTKSSADAANDLFSDSATVSVSASIVLSKPSDVKSTLGKASKTNKQDDLFSTSQPGQSKPSDVSVVLDSDDLHSPPPVSAGQKLIKSTSTVPHDEDDLFASSSVKSSAVKSSKSKPGSDVVQTTKPASAGQPDSSEADATTKSNLVTAAVDGDEDDDIFKDSSLDKRTDASKKSATRKTAAKTDDSVVSTNSRDSRSSRPKKAVTKEAKLFSDATDIFSDIPAASPREAKKKPVKKTSEKKVILKDDVDDIFTETSAAGIKPKNEPKKKMTKSAAVDSDNIFDDPLS